MGEAEEQKIEERVKAINLNSAAASDEISAEEEARAEIFKKAGNDLFKCKFDSSF